MSLVAAVQLQNVSFSYGDRPVLEDVSLTIAQGEFLGVVGPNGGGKTTLLKIMLGLLRPARGKVRIFGQSPGTARRRVGYVPQLLHFAPEFPATVMDVVLMGRLADGMAPGPFREPDRLAARQALEQVDMAGMAGRHLEALSGGEKQRALIARALVCRPEMLLLDEPTVSLDALAERRLYELLSELNDTLTIVLVTHDVGLVSEVLRSVLCVNRRVIRHRTSHINEVDSELLAAMYGSGRRFVRHDEEC